MRALASTLPRSYEVLVRDQRYNWVVVRLGMIDDDEMHELVVDGWWMVVPKRVAAAHFDH